MRKAAPVSPTSGVHATPEIKRIFRIQLETFDGHAKTARPWEDVLAGLEAHRPLPPPSRLRVPFASRRGTFEIQRAREWHEAQEPGLADRSCSASSND
jgi:hypothetical protein